MPMIDWITAHIPITGGMHSPEIERLAGKVIRFSADGVATWEMREWAALKGSYEATINVRGDAGGLWLSGNPIKFLSGQNLDGPSGAGLLLDRALARVGQAVPLPAALAGGAARLTRIDVTKNFDLGNRVRVRELLRVASIVARSRYQGRAATSHDTIYLGKHSRRHSMKLYCKADEIERHRPEGLPDWVFREMQHEAEGLLRVELTLRGMQLKRDDLAAIRDWHDPVVPDQQWARYWNMVELSSGVELMPEAVADLPIYLRRSYHMWLRGDDCFELLSKATRYRHRRAILELTAGAVDIFVLRPARDTGVIGIHDIAAWLRDAPVWRAGGRLAEWIDQATAA